MHNMEGILALMIPIIALCIPVIAILVSHQQKMATIIHGGQANQAQLDELRAEIAELRGRLNQQALAMDNLSDMARRAPDSRFNNLEVNNS